MVGVLAVSGIGSKFIGFMHIQRQSDQIPDKDGWIDKLVSTNKGWAAPAAEQDRLRAPER